MKKIVVFLTLLPIIMMGQSVGIGTTNPDATSVMEVQSTTKGVLIPRLSANPLSPTAGLIYYNTTTNAFTIYNGSTWDTVSNTSDINAAIIFTTTDTTTDLNTASLTNMPVFGTEVFSTNPILYTKNSASQITINKTGRYRIEAVFNLKTDNVNADSGRVAIRSLLRVGSTYPGASFENSYIRNQGDNAIAGNTIRSTMVVYDVLEITAGSTLSFQTQQVAAVTGTDKKILFDNALVSKLIITKIK